MTFEFMYGGEWYKYEDGYIKKEYGTDFYVRFCPVQSELTDIIESIDIEHLRIIMAAIVHGYFHGEAAGQKHKIQEFKRVFNID